MTPQDLLRHNDTGEPWTDAPSRHGGYDLARAYRDALEVRAMRIARGEFPCGFKIGFTNRGIWPRYQVFAPIWGTVWNTTLVMCDGVNEGALSLAHTCQPRIEPETVFGLRSTPPADASIDALFDAIAWVAPGFEIVQSHLPDWKFAAPDLMQGDVVTTGTWTDAWPDAAGESWTADFGTPLAPLRVRLS